MPDRVIPEEYLTRATIHRVVVHWTAGSYRPSGLDRSHYHAVLEDLEAQGGLADKVRVVRGIHAPGDNDRTSDGDYAAHTRGLNSNSYGLSAACMGEDRNRGQYCRPGGPYGPWPLTSLLWERLAQAAADVAARYELAVTPRTVLQHGEVQEVYGIAQRGKWDCTELPFAPGKSREEVCQEFRDKVSWYLRTYHNR